MGKKITQLATITEVADDDLIVGVDVSDTSGSDNGTNKKFTKASLLDGLAPLDPQITGWNPLGEDLVYVSVDDPTGVVKVEGKDITDKLSVGMRLRFTNGGNVINAIITAIAFSVDTTITFLHEIDPADSQALYLLANSAITLPYFSSQKAPFGFPMSPAKWSVEITNNQRSAQVNVTANTWYNLGSITISVPIGTWDLLYKVVAVNVGGASVKSSLSTSNNSVSDNDFTQRFSGVNPVISPMFMTKVVSVASKTSYYLLAMSVDASTTALRFHGDEGTTIIRATCAYL